MQIGILGIGHLAENLLAGWRAAGRRPGTMLLSPRGKGPKLARAWGYGLARDNADLVARSAIVVLAVRPADARAALEGLPWRAGQIVVSACAGVSCAALAPLAAPAQICRIMPLTAAAIQASPVPLYPDLAPARALAADLGPVIALNDEAEFETATVAAAAYGWALSLIAQSAAWSQARGLAPDTARALWGATFAAAGQMACALPGGPDAPPAQGIPDAPAAQGIPGAPAAQGLSGAPAAPLARDMQGVLRDLVTPGGITECGLQSLAAAGQPAAWDQAMAAVLAKLTGPTG